tara:strand:- start:529 stop:690 length:162 start_codon:yes stop_codon:yes gene_type:complete
MTKTRVTCINCDADFEISHDMNDKYFVEYCPFCGSEIDDFEMDELEELDNEEW